MKQILTFGLLFLTLNIFSQNKSDTTNIKTTSKYAGKYAYGKNIEKERIGVLTVYAESDTTLLFYIDLNRGAPSYNMGSLYGRIIVRDDSGVFYKAGHDSAKGCKLLFKFSKNKCKIITFEDQDYCDFGFGVFADGEFKKEKTSPPDNFVDQTGRKIYFRKTKPEEYER